MYRIIAKLTSHEGVKLIKSCPVFKFLIKNAKLSAISTIDMNATTAVDQTLTCNIGDVTQAVDVTWKDNDVKDITHNQGWYTINEGTVNGSNVQVSTLTIAAATLGALDTSSPLTWKCAAKSTLYPDSENSTYSDMVVTFLQFGTLVDCLV